MHINNTLDNNNDKLLQRECKISLSACLSRATVQKSEKNSSSSVSVSSSDGGILEVMFGV